MLPLTALPLNQENMSSSLNSCSYSNLDFIMVASAFKSSKLAREDCPARINRPIRWLPMKGKDDNFFSNFKTISYAYLALKSRREDV